MATIEVKDGTEVVAEVLSMGGEPRPRQREDGTPKLLPDGRPTFSTGVVGARADGGLDRGITVAVVEPRSTHWGPGSAQTGGPG